MGVARRFKSIVCPQWKIKVARRFKSIVFPQWKIKVARRFKSIVCPQWKIKVARRFIYCVPLTQRNQGYFNNIINNNRVSQSYCVA